MPHLDSVHSFLHREGVRPRQTRERHGNDLHTIDWPRVRRVGEAAQKQASVVHGIQNDREGIVMRSSVDRKVWFSTNLVCGEASVRVYMKKRRTLSAFGL